MSKHHKAGSAAAIRPIDDLIRNPGINSSKGMTMAGAEPEDIEGESTFEGDVENDVVPNRPVTANQRGRTNS
ncbi:hypothetical protein GCM10011390_10720 [Aureimonas endophytica]|uniref:Uncharacterized protein n=1 Tax=Aureimonas endophytica TaxID=2027858 RepID=A0A917E1U7_9HYPH|nr:hypothetical protein [Aureimonas endophytica]GGD93840.1 hypothetical protein GCM10011390_10720 [Aureimonas endophytica]